MDHIEVPEGPLGTFNDLLSQIQGEIANVKSGAMTESQARVVLGYRKAELKIAELGLQYLRLVKPRGGAAGGQIPILPGTDASASTTSAAKTEQAS